MSIQLNDNNIPDEVLVVASKLKKYVKSRSGFNTSDAVMKVISDRVRDLADEAMRNAAADGRKTVKDRDVRSTVSNY